MIDDFKNSARPKNQNKNEEASAVELLKVRQWLINAFKSVIFSLGYHKTNIDNDLKNPLPTKTPTIPPVILNLPQKRLTQETKKILSPK